MEEKNKGLEKIAFREHIVTDQGNGGSSCSNCNYDLGSDPSKNYDTCPKCGYRLMNGGIFFPNLGGSDF